MMTSSTIRPLAAKVVTVSDRVAAGVANDSSGSAVAELFERSGFTVTSKTVVPDGVEVVSRAILDACNGFTGIVATTGGTGFSARDVTPEATACVIEREAPGLAEAMRSANALGRLTRGVAGTIGTSIVVNLPGSPAGAVECLQAIVDVLPHAISLLAGDTEH